MALQGQGQPLGLLLGPSAIAEHSVPPLGSQHSPAPALIPAPQLHLFSVAQETALFCGTGCFAGMLYLLCRDVSPLFSLFLWLKSLLAVSPVQCPCPLQGSAVPVASAVGGHTDVTTLGFSPKASICLPELSSSSASPALQFSFLLAPQDAVPAPLGALCSGLIPHLYVHI